MSGSGTVVLGEETSRELLYQLNDVIILRTPSAWLFAPILEIFFRENPLPIYPLHRSMSTDFTDDAVVQRVWGYSKTDCCFLCSSLLVHI